MSSTLEPSEPSAVEPAHTASPQAHAAAAESGRSRRPVLLKVLLPLVIVAAVVVAIVVAVRSIYHDGVRPGTLVEATTLDSTDNPHKAVVQLPLGALTVEVGKPTQNAPQYEQKKAADGASWVPIDWQLGGPGADYSNNNPAFQFSVVLVADGRRYDLQAGQSTDDTASVYTPVVKSKSADVVVQGSGRHLKVEVGYDGVTQTLDVDHGTIAKGLAAPLYGVDAGLLALPTSNCNLLSAADQRRYQPLSGGQCTVGEVDRVPYVGGLGWAGSGRTWLQVPLDVSAGELDPRSGDRLHGYEINDVRYRVTVDGHAPQTELLSYYQADALSATLSKVLVFRTATHPKSLRVTLTSHAVGRVDLDTKRTFTSTKTYALR